MMFRSSDVKYLFGYLLPFTMLIGLSLGGWYVFLTVLTGFVVIPILEILIPFRLNTDEPDDASHIIYDLMLYVNVPILYALLVLFLQFVSSAESTYEQIGAVMSFGIILGTNGINVAHELGHRTTWYEKLLAWLLLLPCLFTYFTVEHNRGHHKHVGTPRDPATAPKGRSIYRYWLRAVPGVFINAWKLESERLSREGRSILGFGNEVLRGLIAHIVYLGIIYSFFGSLVVMLAFIAAVYSILLLEAINYIEHYGLEREKLANGFYERVEPRHSWNSDRILGRIVLYELSRHSDHHHRATKEYQNLRNHSDAPELPTGYPGSLLLTLVPILWYRMVDKRIPKLD